MTYANDANKTHCLWGHEFTHANTLVTPRRNSDGKVIGRMRTCRACQTRRRQEYLQRKAILQLWQEVQHAGTD